MRWGLWIVLIAHQLRPEAKTMGTARLSPLLPPQWQHHPLLHSIFPLLNLLPLASHHLFFETPMLTFPESSMFNWALIPREWLCSCHRNSRPTKQRGESVVSDRQLSPCPETLRLKNIFLIFPCDRASGSVGGLGTFAAAFSLSVNPDISPPGFLLQDAHVLRIHPYGSIADGKHQEPHTCSVGKRGRVTEC